MKKPFYRQFKPGRIFMGRLHFGDDLLESLVKFCEDKKIKCAALWLIGAVQNANLGYYGQKEKKYVSCASLNKKLEIAGCSGNVSRKDGKVSVHCHVVLADYTGRAYGGHLLSGTMVFAAEFCIRELKGRDLNRVEEKQTGLPLWG